MFDMDELDQNDLAHVTAILDVEALKPKDIAARQTTDGLTEWADDLIKGHGRSKILSSYDDSERVAELKDGTWFPYIRI